MFSIRIYKSTEKYTDQMEHELEKKRLTTQILLFAKYTIMAFFGVLYAVNEIWAMLEAKEHYIFCRTRILSNMYCISVWSDQYYELINQINSDRPCLMSPKQ